MAHGTKDVLGHMDRLRLAGGCRFAILVGDGSDDSTGRPELVDRLP